MSRNDEMTERRVMDRRAVSATDWRPYHSALSKCAELLPNMKDGDPLVEVPKFLAAHKPLAASPAAPTVPTDGRNAVLEEVARHFEVEQFDQQKIAFVVSEIRALKSAAHRPLAASAVPAGWKLVPIEPTEEMLSTLDHADAAMKRIYQAMIRAASLNPAATMLDGQAALVDGKCTFCGGVKFLFQRGDVFYGECPRCEIAPAQQPASSEVSE